MKKSAQRRSRHRRLAFETLEPRALLSADLLPVATLPEAPAPIAAEFREYVATDSTPVILAAAEPPRELVIVDGMVAEADRLAADWRDRGFEVVVLDPAQDAITQIDDLLATRTGLAAVHLVSHGTDGALQLGGTTFDAATLSARSAEVARWSQAFAADGDLLLYGCDVAGDAWGGAFIDRLALLTGADVAASTDDTGAALLGGNWSLEYATGAIETHTLDAADWLHLLAPQTITWSAVAWTNGSYGPVNIAIGSLGNVVVTLSGDTAQLQANSPSIGSNLQGGFGGSAGSSLNLDSNGGFASTQSVNVLFDFSALPGEVVDLSFYVFDIDISSGGGGFIDRVTATANAGALDPTISNLGANVFASSANTVTGQTGNSSNPSGNGNALFTFTQRGLTSINLNYGNANTTGQSTQGIGLNTITFYIAPKNTAPATVTTPENTAFAFTGGNALSVSDDDATSVTLSVANGTLGLTASGGATLGGSGGNRTISGTLASINATLASLVYTPNAGYNGTDTLTFTSSDGTYSDTDTIAISVTPVNDVPVLGNVAGDARSYAAGAGAVVIDQGALATVTDVDSADFNGGSLTVSIVSGGVAAEDILGISTAGTVSLSAGVTIGSTVSVGGTAIGTITSTGTSGASLTVALNASATPTRVESLIRAITYQDSSAVNPTPGTRTIRFIVNDGDGGTSAAVDATVAVKPVASIAATDSTAAEPANNGQFTVSLSAASATNTVLTYSIGGTAANGTDYGNLTGSVTVLAGATSATIDVAVVDDARVEPGETVVLTLTGISSGDSDIRIRSDANTATVNLADDDTAQVSIAATSAAAEPGTHGVFTVSMTKASSTDTVVSYSVVGTATAGTDYTTLSGSVTILAGNTSATVTVPVLDDLLVEATETVVLTLTAVAGDPDISLNGAASTATVNIADNDSAQVAIAATTAAAAEGGANGLYTVTLSNASSTATTLSYTVTGTATAGSDYTALSGTVTIAAGATTATIPVTVTNDALVEASETVVVTLNTITAGDPDISINGAANAATVAIADNDTALVSIATTANAAEPGTGGLFTVSMSNASSTDTVVAFTVSGTAVSGVDFTALPVSATILAGSTTATIAVPVIDDALVEATETVIATLTGITSGDADIAIGGAASTATVAITDNDTALVSIAATAPNAAEGGAGGTFTVSMTHASSTDTIITYTVGGTAAAGTDYTALTGTVTIVAGATSATIPVTVTNDALVELAESVTVTLAGVAGDPDISIDAGANAATVNVADNDSALVSIAATDATAAEPANNGRYTVSMSAAASTDTVIAYAIGGTAAAGSDYAALSGTVTILAGTTSATIDVSVLNDLVVEGDEVVGVTLTSIASGDADIAIDGAANAATVTIADDDSALVSIAATTAAAEPGTTGRFTVTLSQASSTDTVIAYGIAGTALGGTDYAALSGTVTIAAGSTTAFIDAGVIDDALVEANETVALTLTSITSGDPDISIDGAANAATVVITDSDTAQVSIAATGAAAEPGTSGQFTVTLSAVSSTDTVVSYTVGGTALAGTDYTALSGTVTILAGSTTATIAVPVLGDSLVEATESVAVTLTGFVSADPDISIDGAANVATVNVADDDDALVSIAATTPGAAEPGTNGRFTVSMTNASSTDTVIAYTIAGTAANGVDYALLSGSVTVLAGATSATIDVSVLDELIVEANETVALTLTGVTAGDPDVSIDGAANAATVTIADNDAALVSIAATTPNAAEPGASGRFTVSMSLASSTDTVVSYTVGGTAIAGTDYTTLSGTVTILAGSTSATIDVPMLDDAIVEGSESVVVTLGAITAGDADIAIDGAANAATVAIADNDSALASIAVTAAPAEPGTAGQFTVTLSNVSSTDTVLGYSVAGSAAAGVDYAVLSGTITIAAGSSSATIALNVSDDALVEANETVAVTLTAITAGDPDIAIDGAAASATAAITDDDTALVSIAPTTPAAAEGAAAGRFTVSMTHAASTDTVIAYVIAGTAANGTDYALLSGAVTIVAGSTTAFIDVAAIDDAIVEATETVALTLTGITSGDPQIAIDGAAASATASIADNDAATLSVGDVTVNEAAGTISFSVSVDRAVQGGFTVDAMFAGGTATGGADYANATQTLAFAGNAGETQTVTLAAVDDAVVEATESFGVSLANVTPATAPATSIDASDTASGTILDNDVATLAIADVTAGEAAGAINFAVTVDLAVQGGFTVDVLFTDGSATGGVDYTAALQTLNFAGTAGETVLVTVPVANDALVEANETFTIALGNLVPATAPSGSMVITDTAVGTIANDDDAPTVADATVPLQENPAAGTAVIDLSDAVTLGDADPDGDAITYSIIAGNGAGAFTINAATGAITVANPLPLDFETTPTFVLTVLASDGTNTDTATVTIDLVNVNEAPTATVPGAQTVAEDTPLTLSVLGGNGIAVADVDAANLRVTLSAARGTVTLATVARLTFTTGDGTADAAMTFSGSLAAINAALDGLVYAPAAHYNGADALDVLLDDQGQSGVGGAQTLAAAIPVTVTAVNDAPAVAGDLALAVAEGNAVTIAASDLAGVDVDDAGTGLVYTLAGAPAHGQLEFIDAAGAAITSFTQADLDAGRVRYVHDGSETTADVFTVMLADGGEDGAAPVFATLNVSVAPVNDAPRLVAGDGTIDQGSRLVLTAAQVGAVDPDSAADTLVYVVDGTSGGFIEIVTASGVPIASFTGAQLSSGLVRFVQADAAATSAGFSVHVSDGQAASAPGVVVLTLRATGGLPPQDAPAAPAPLDVLELTSAAGESRITTMPVPQVAQFIRAPLYESGGPVLAEPEPFVPPTSRTRLAASGAIETPSVEIASSGLRFEAPGLGEISIPQLEFSFQSVRYDLPGAEDAAPGTRSAIVEAVQIAGLALTAGGVWWVLRIGSLIGSALVSAPAWRHIDPLPVLGGRDREDDVDWEGDDEPSESGEAAERFFDQASAKTPQA